MATSRSMDSSYSSLFTQGLLNSSTPRASLHLPLPAFPTKSHSLPLAERRRTPPPTPLIIPPARVTPAKQSPHTFSASRKTPRSTCAGARRRSSVSSPAHALLKSPTRAELLRTRELHLIQAKTSRRSHGENMALLRDEASAGGRMSSVWTAPAAVISRLRRRALPISAPSPPPMKPLPALPGQNPADAYPSPLSLNIAVTYPSSATTPPLTIEIPQPKVESFSMEDEDEDMT
ncbi:hypothetical protein DACRYDRAFT_99363 [Dacryopinax primogenitus]|uniref:Uncharacterized protein n=1 Tax=Dacryopinax primogenitus (strain DJM 731) TaxID=1858805 RepID=M5GF68_DACPD|nr:uncharacterized protein DACRYDRAFT_99363 [Dacryopinax primogenitus]EJU03893.1 hypothetical protein DACRYDRAFT_99363 [Dacryopinax primogenitus]